MALSLLRGTAAPLAFRRCLATSCKLRQIPQPADASSEFNQGSFDQLPLNERLLNRLKTLGFSSMFEIQAKTIPLSLAGKDVLGRAATGSGKTLCFAVPVVNSLSATPSTGRPRALAILPTRELCIQVKEAVADLAPDLKVACIYGGDSRYQQMMLLRSVDIVVGTPGRLCDFFRSGDLQLNDVQFLVLDEMDELLTPSFLVQIEGMISEIPKSKQAMMFSATMPPQAQSIASRFMKEAEYVDLTSSMARVPSSVEHLILPCVDGREPACIMHLLDLHKPKRSIVFAPSKRSAQLLSDYLASCGISCQSLHGDVSQNARTRIFRDFKAGRFQLLVSTDVAARGLDVPDLELVVQCGAPPNGVEYYIHRSGRTGRGGRDGKSVLLCYEHNRDFMFRLKEEVEVKMIEPPPYNPNEHNPSKPWEGIVHGLELGRRHDGRPKNHVRHGGGGFGGNRFGDNGGRFGRSGGGGGFGRGGFGGNGGGGGFGGGGNGGGFGRGGFGGNDGGYGRSGFGGNDGGYGRSGFGGNDGGYGRSGFGGNGGGFGRSSGSNNSGGGGFGHNSFGGDSSGFGNGHFDGNDRLW